uniref:Uncharacterized protein n=1 Tax=Strongyloides papillosus TaxID=174720 RepID=A0A0N5CD16_STREA
MSSSKPTVLPVNTTESQIESISSSDIIAYIVCGILALITLIVFIIIIWKKCRRRNSKDRISKVKIADKRRARATKRYLKKHKSIRIPVDKNGLPKLDKSKKKSSKNIGKIGKIKNDNISVDKVDSKKIKSQKINEHEFERIRTPKIFMKSKENSQNLEKNENIEPVGKVKMDKVSKNMHENKEILKGKLNTVNKENANCFDIGESFDNSDNRFLKVEHNLPLTLVNYPSDNREYESLKNYDDLSYMEKEIYRPSTGEFNFENSKNKKMCQIHGKNERVSIFTLHGNNSAWVQNEDQFSDFSFQISTDSSENNK